MKRFGILFFILIFVTIPCFSLDLTEGRIKITLDENSGHFSAYFLDDVNSGKYIPLLFEKDPETTILSIMVDNKIYKMGNSSFFTRETYSMPTGGKIVWKSTILQVTEEFTFLKSKESSLSDGLKVLITVKNLSDKTNLIGISYLLDTYLGEDQNSHFVLDSGTKIDSENSFMANFPNYWISPSKKSSFLGLQGMIRGPGITVPSKLIFANWKRLKDNLWNYDVKKSRNFNLIPYSINDSAVALIYGPIKVESKSERTVVLAMGGFNNSSFSASSSLEESGIDELFDKTVSTKTDPQDTETSVKTDLIATTDLLKKIDTLLQYPDNATNNEIDLIVQILETLKQRKTLYENR